jgi:hypothetical protein
LSDQDSDIITTTARKLGASAGKAAGSWAIDGTTTAEAARRILKGYEDGDPAVLDMQPSPLSGEWAGGPTEDDVLDEIELYANTTISGDALGGDGIAEIIGVWLDGYSEGYWDEVIRAARHAAEVAA